jgi:hypothetical protein
MNREKQHGFPPSPESGKSARLIARAHQLFALCSIRMEDAYVYWVRSFIQLDLLAEISPSRFSLFFRFNGRFGGNFYRPVLAESCRPTILTRRRLGCRAAFNITFSKQVLHVTRYQDSEVANHVLHETEVFHTDWLIGVSTPECK